MADGVDWESVVRPFLIGARCLRRQLLPWWKPPRCFADSLAQIFGARSENEWVHHHSEARAELYRSVDSGSTELETLNFLHALVHLYKPALILETGVYRGMGSLALASGLQLNGRGKLLALDPDPGALRLARRHAWFYDRRLLKHIEFICLSSLEFLEKYAGPPFQMAFLDSLLPLRPRELELLLHRNLLEPGALVAIHDTSRVRAESPGFAAHAWLDELVSRHEGLEMPFSRGLRLLRWLGPGR